MESMMKERFSNILAWAGLLPFLAVIMLAGYVMVIEGVTLERIFSEPTPFLVAAAIYACCATLNYLMVGRFRFLPWK